MPFYTYKRSDGTEFTKRQSIKSKPLKKCPKTGLPVKRVISSGSFILKGSGFFANDYGKG